MESSIAAPSESTGSTTIADMAALAAERFGVEHVFLDIPNPV